MEKLYISPFDMLSIATDHAYCAEYLLQMSVDISTPDIDVMNPLIPITTLIYKAFQLTFKAFVFYEQRAIKQYKNFHELIELNHHLGLSAQDRELLKLLGMQQSFNKGVRYDVWANQQELQVFCEKLLDLYERVQDLRPIELQADYQQSQ